MEKKRSPKLTPTNLQALLITLIPLIVTVSGIGFWFFRGHLVTYAKQVNADSAVAAASDDNIAQLQKIKTELDNDQAAVTRAKNMVADSQHYQYQNQIISDITSYANAAGITITGFTFSTGNNGKGTGTVPAATPLPGAPTVPVGLKSTVTSINIKSPVSYHAIMNFIHAIELNLTKMELTGISLSRQDATGKVSVNPITIEVYTR